MPLATRVHVEHGRAERPESDGSVCLVKAIRGNQAGTRDGCRQATKDRARGVREVRT